jgi:hypothetical protein
MLLDKQIQAPIVCGANFSRQRIQLVLFDLSSLDRFPNWEAE